MNMEVESTLETSRVSNRPSVCLVLAAVNRMRSGFGRVAKRDKDCRLRKDYSRGVSAPFLPQCSCSHYPVNSLHTYHAQSWGQVKKHLRHVEAVNNGMLYVKTHVCSYAHLGRQFTSDSINIYRRATTAWQRRDGAGPVTKVGPPPHSESSINI
jgi:hypothetical protein